MQGGKPKRKSQGTLQIAKQENTFPALFGITLGCPLFSSLPGAGGISQLSHGVSVLCHISLRSAAAASVVTALTGRLVLCVKSSSVATATF